MISIDRCRKIEPELQNLTDEEILEILEDYYGINQLAYEKWIREWVIPKIP
jgi:hypothetical protein